jgi:hypothetical protein
MLMTQCVVLPTVGSAVTLLSKLYMHDTLHTYIEGPIYSSWPPGVTHPLVQTAQTYING